MLIDSIDEAAVLPERWPGVLQKLADDFRSVGAMIIRATPSEQRSITSPPIEDTVRQFEQTALTQQNVRVQRLAARPPYPGFVTDLDLVTMDEIRTLPIYTQWLIPKGCEVGAGTIIQGTREESLLVSIEGLPGHAAARAMLPALDALRPHLARSALMSARFAFERMRTAVNMLDLVGIDAGLIDARGHVKSSNSGFEARMAGRLGANGRIMLPERAAQQQFNRALSAIADGSGASIGIRNGGGTGFQVLHMVPIRGDARDIFSDMAGLLVVIDPTQRTTAGTGILQSLFDLTPAEARVADALAAGISPRDIATNFALSQETIRTHLKRVFSKIGVSRQSDLVAMLGRLSFPEIGRNA